MIHRLPLLARFALGLLAVAAPLALGGCNPAGDEQNPISPDKMNEMRAKENASRRSHTPPPITGHGPGAGAAGAGTSASSGAAGKPGP